MAALSQPDCRFEGGDFITWTTRLRYGGDAKALSLFLERLVNCQNVIESISFTEDFEPEVAWQVVHSGDERFQIQINLHSKELKLEELVIPDVRGGNQK